MNKNSRTKMKCFFRIMGLLFLTLISACSDKMTIQFELPEQMVEKNAPGGTINVELIRSSRRTVDLPFVPTTHTSDEVLIPYTVSGTSESGVNHNLSNGVLRIPAGESHETLPFSILDGSFAGTKTIVINLSAPQGVQPGQITSHTVYLGDPNELRPFISTWNTDPYSSSEKTISLPLEADGTYDFNVDWGDGTQNRIKAWDDPNTTHTYPSPGVYTVTITGTIVGFRFTNGEHDKISNISQFGSLRLGNNGGYFYGAVNLTISATDPLNLMGTTNFYRAFRECFSLSTAPSMATWDTSAVTNMSEMFFQANNFNENIERWNTGNVTNMGGMLFQATQFNQSVGNWDTSKVTDMSWMFAYADKFNQDLSNWNTSNVTDMHYMFSWAQLFNQDIGRWNTAKVNNMEGMFQSAKSFNQNITNWNTGSVINMQAMFEGAEQFNQNIGNWDTSKVTNMGGMFGGANRFDQNIGHWNIESVVVGVGLIQGFQQFFSRYYPQSLSTGNYDALLIGWSSQNVKSGHIFDAGQSKYSPAAAAARAHLVNDKGWTIYDGGPQ